MVAVVIFSELFPVEIGFLSESTTVAVLGVVVVPEHHATITGFLINPIKVACHVSLHVLPLWH